MSTTEQGAQVRDNPGVAPEPRSRITRRVSAGHALLLVVGLLAALTNFAVLRSADATVRVAAAARDLRPGEILAADALTFTDVDVGEGVAATLLRPGEVERFTGSVVANHVRAGELLTRTDLSRPATDSGLRAMSIPVEPAHAVGGALRAGDRIDVIEVLDGSARYIAVDVEVLAVTDGGGGAALGGLTPYSVTVAVDDASALLLAAAVRADAVELVRSTGAERARVDDRARNRVPGPRSADGTGT
ncbi:MAG TPA: RcpC/CpaB family pilus assembly protein [Nitriliruptorales bacterium]|nr:RcpC/CpaB family pilus assembly protein [Nitriliruptorales bacterium]